MAEPDPLTPEVLDWAYRHGIFPMDVEGRIEWFCPDPRAILPLDGFHVSDTLRRLYNQGRFELRVDTCFGDVMRACAERDDGTWISGEIIDAYEQLHRLGNAHSVEPGRRRVGRGLYAVRSAGASSAVRFPSPARRVDDRASRDVERLRTGAMSARHAVHHAAPEALRRRRDSAARVPADWPPPWRWLPLRRCSGIVSRPGHG